VSIRDSSGFSKNKLKDLKREMINFSRMIEDNFFSLLPSAITATPEMSRTRGRMKSSCGNVMAMSAAAYSWRRRLGKSIAQMSVMQNALRAVLDRLGISYEIDVSPSLETDWKHEEEDEFAPAGGQETTEERVGSFVRGVGQLLHLDLTKVSSPVDKLGVVEKELKRVLGSGELATVDLSPPVSSPPINGLKRRAYSSRAANSARGQSPPPQAREKPEASRSAGSPKKGPRVAKQSEPTSVSSVAPSEKPLPSSPRPIESIIAAQPSSPAEDLSSRRIPPFDSELSDQNIATTLDGFQENSTTMDESPDLEAILGQSGEIETNGDESAQIEATLTVANLRLWKQVQICWWIVKLP
jgi:hypothetical protein